MRMFGAPRRPTRRGSAAGGASATNGMTTTNPSSSRRQKNDALQARLARENAKIAQMNNTTTTTVNRRPHKISPVPVSPRRTRSTEDLAAAIPPSPPIRQQSKEQHEDSKMPAKNHKTNDEDDTPPSPPLMILEEDELEEYKEEVAPAAAAAAAPESQPKMIQVSPGVSMRLRDANETKQAIKDDNFTPCLCWACQESIFCIADASYVVCPVCQSIGPMMDTGDSSWGSFDIVDGGVGLGFTIEDLEVMQWDCINESYYAP